MFIIYLVKVHFRIRLFVAEKESKRRKKNRKLNCSRTSTALIMVILGRNVRNNIIYLI